MLHVVVECFGGGDGGLRVEVATVMGGIGVAQVETGEGGDAMSFGKEGGMGRGEEEEVWEEHEPGRE